MMSEKTSEAMPKPTLWLKREEGKDHMEVCYKDSKRMVLGRVPFSEKQSRSEGYIRYFFAWHHELVWTVLNTLPLPKAGGRVEFVLNDEIGSRVVEEDGRYYFLPPDSEVD